MTMDELFAEHMHAEVARLTAELEAAKQENDVDTGIAAAAIAKFSESKQELAELKRRISEWHKQIRREGNGQQWVNHKITNYWCAPEDLDKLIAILKGG